MKETDIIILLIVLIFLWCLFCVKMGAGRMGKIVGVLMVILVLTFIKWDIRPLEQEQYHSEYTKDIQFDFTEDKERNRREGILYTIDDTEKETLTSYNGEICVKIPRWKEFTTTCLTEKYGEETLHMTTDINYDSMTYELLAAWDIEEAEEKIAEDFLFHHCDNVLGDTYHLTVEGINICYLPCYHNIFSERITWHYTIWADLGCGQVLKTEITQGMIGDEALTRAYDYETVPQEVTKPLNIEGIIEMLYSNIEIYSAEGDAIPVVYRESLPESDERETYKFSFGAVRNYKTDEYMETTVCAELIESLYEAVQAGTIEELLRREAIEENELSIAEKMDYIKKEKTGKLKTYDSLFHYYGEKNPMKYCLLKGADESKEFLVHLRESDAKWFLCEKDSTGTIRAQKGINIFYKDTSEPYFLSYQENPYLCIVNRDAGGEVESVVLHDFATPDYIGTLIYIDVSSVRLCSYIRNEGTYGTEVPWYQYLDNSIDSGKEYYAVLGQWEITEYLGESDYRHVEETDSEAYAGEQERTQDLVDTYLGQELEMSWDDRGPCLETFGSASVYGYYYTSLENLYKVYGQPETLDMEAPIFCATLQAFVFKEDIDLIVDKNKKAAICVEGRFFRLERSDEEELRTWE